MVDDPRSLGVPLRRTTGTGAATLWRYRVGGWRIVARIEDDVLCVLVLRIAHRARSFGDCKGSSSFPRLWSLKSPHPQVMFEGSSARTSPAARFITALLARLGTPT